MQIACDGGQDAWMERQVGSNGGLDPDRQILGMDGRDLLMGRNEKGGV